MRKLSDTPRLLTTTGQVLVYDPVECDPIPALLWDHMVKHGVPDHRLEEIGHDLMRQARQEIGEDASLTDLAGTAIGLSF